MSIKIGIILLFGLFGFVSFFDVSHDLTGTPYSFEVRMMLGIIGGVLFSTVTIAIISISILMTGKRNQSHA